MRELRSINEYTVSFYVSFTMAILYGLMVFLPGNDLRAATSDFVFMDWLLLLGVSACSCILQLSMARAS